jgi:NADP-dependent 3-hydroxy acid dehydrogenase YdfG
MATSAKIAVITGAGSGIGRASAHCLLEDGWSFSGFPKNPRRS